MLAQDRNPEISGSIPDEDLGLAAIAQEYQEAPRNSHGEWTFLRRP